MAELGEINKFFMVEKSLEDNDLIYISMPIIYEHLIVCREV